jgi:iron-regulated transporter 1
VTIRLIFLRTVTLSFSTTTDNGALITGYLDWRTRYDSSINQAMIGAQRGLGSIFGLLGTFVFPKLERWLGSVPRAGLFAIWLFWITLVPAAVILLTVGDCVESDFALMTGMILARVGLWAFDLAERQIMQEWIDEADRGKVNGMQTSGTQLAYVCIQAAGIVFPDPKDFGQLVVFSILAVLAAALLYTLWMVRERNHPAMLQMEEDTRRAAAAAMAQDEWVAI